MKEVEEKVDEQYDYFSFGNEQKEQEDSVGYERLLELIDYDEDYNRSGE